MQRVLNNMGSHLPADLAVTSVWVPLASRPGSDFAMGATCQQTWQ